jgi:hypothetical protein
MSDPKPVSNNRGIRLLRLVTGVLVFVFVITLAAISFMYFTTPPALRRPTTEHFHFRMDLVIAGKSVNFADDKYQTDYMTDSCSALLTKQPVHFHDHTNQFVHIHWASITGGEVLKDYGWNLIGGFSNTLGLRFDRGNIFRRTPIHGDDLPALPEGAKEYIYVGDATNYTERTWSSFVEQPLPVFFRAPLDGHSNETEVTATSTDEQKLVQLNHVIGSTVIFVQSGRPTDAQIKDHFTHLEPLPLTQCAG